MEIKELRSHLTTVDVICDVCNKSCAKCGGFEYATLFAVWGYGSSKDGEDHICHLCEECYIKVGEFIEGLGGEIRIENKFE